jgi:hypothetical protein
MPGNAHFFPATLTLSQTCFPLLRSAARRCSLPS